MKNRKTQGFTLIELLIVIAIIGILAAVLIPNLLGARQRAYDTAAQSCAKALATAEETYQIDFNKYTAFAAIDATTGTASPLTATNTCKGIALKVAGTLDAAGSYSATVQHASGSHSYTVSPAGIVSGALL